MSKWNWPDELEPPHKYNLLVALNDGSIRVVRRLTDERDSKYREVDTKNRLKEEEFSYSDIYCWTTCKYVPHGKTPVTAFGQKKLARKLINQEKFYEEKKRKALEGIETKSD